MFEPPTTTLATVGSRVLARLVDGLIVAAVSLSLVLATSDTDFDAPSWVPYLVAGFAIVYEVSLIARQGQTVGKRLVGIQVVDATTGTTPSLDQSVRRAFPAILNLVPYVGWLSVVAYVSAIWRPRRQGWHDTLAGTIVVTTRVRPGPGYPSS